MGFWDASISSSDPTRRHIQYKYCMWQYSGRRDQATAACLLAKQWSICVKWWQDSGFLFLLVFFFFQVLQSLTWNVRIPHKDHNRLTLVSAKPKIYSPRRGYLSPGNSIVFGNSSYFIIHQRHNFSLILGLILLKLKHASDRPVYFRDLCTRYLQCVPYHISTHVCKFVKLENYTW